MLQALSDFISKVTRGEKVHIGDAEAQWKKVAELTPGMLIAVPREEAISYQQSAISNPPAGEAGQQSSTDVLWDEIVSIKRLSPERVYDIEVEGTHNFVAGHYVDRLTGKAIFAEEEEALNVYLTARGFFGGEFSQEQEEKQQSNQHQTSTDIHLDPELSKINHSSSKYLSVLTASDKKIIAAISEIVKTSGSRLVKGARNKPDATLEETEETTRKSPGFRFMGKDIEIRIERLIELVNTYYKKKIVYGGIVAHNTTGKALAVFNETGDQNILTASASGTARLVLTSAGNLGIGTTSPLAKLDVNGTASVSGALTLYGTPTIVSTSMKSLTLGDANTGNLIIGSTLPTSTTGNYLCINAGVVGSGTSCSLSSQKFKTDITPLSDGGLAEVLALAPVSFTFKPGFGDNGATTQLGFIAEQAAAVDPRLVTFDKDGAPSGFVYANYTAVLTKAIQEQQGAIARLDSQFVSLTPGPTPTAALTTTTIDDLVAKKALVLGPVQFQGPAVFAAIAEFIDRVIFRGEVRFGGLVVFPANTGGRVVLAPGATEATVIFPQPFKEPPIVTLSQVLETATESARLMERGAARAAAAGVSAHGFTVVLDLAPTRTVTYHWIALSVDGAETTRAGTPDALLSVTPTPTPTPTIAPSATSTPIATPTPTPTATPQLTPTPPVSLEPIPPEATASSTP